MQLICGINPVLEALNGRTRHFDRLLVVKGLRNRRVSETMARAGQMGIPLRFEARETLDRMAGGLPHQGVIAVVSAKPVISLETLLGEARDPALVVILDGVEDPRNLGAILRTAEAAGADGVVLPERHSAGLSETVARASAGALEHVRVARVGNVAQAITELKARGIWVVGFDAEGTERWESVDYKRPTAIVLGGEGRGIRRLVRERCDHLVSVPLFGHVASLNVSVVAGVALYEAVRQRGVVPSHVRPIPAKRVLASEPIVGPAPDDAEDDPGLLDPRVASPAGAELDELDGHEDEETVIIGGIMEEVAWASPPPAARASAHAQPAWRGRADRKVDPAPDKGGEKRRAGRRRRHRRKHGGDGAHRASGPQAAASPQPQAIEGQPPQPASEGQPDGPPRQARSGRRRRHRRRR